MKRYATYVLFLVILLTGCSNGDYDKMSIEFERYYIEIANNVYLKDEIKTLKNMKNEETIETLSKMKQLLEKVKTKVPNSKQKHYEILWEMYNDIEFLIYASEKEWSELSVEERGRVYSEIIQIEMTKENIQNKK